jgi:hypothetical protein
MGAEEIKQFLIHLAVERHVAASTQNQALCGLARWIAIVHLATTFEVLIQRAVLYFYRKVLKREIEHVDVVWAQRPKRMPEVFTPEEAMTVVNHLEGKYWMLGMLMYGAGLREIECLRLRVHPVR